MLSSGDFHRGERLPAESKLASEFGISRMTLRSAMGDLEREGLIRRERNQGCFFGSPAPTAKVEQSPITQGLMARTVVLITDLKAAVGRDLFDGQSASVVSGVMDKAARANLDFLRLTADERDDTWINELLKLKVRGVVLSCWTKSLDWQYSVIARLQQQDVPVVVWANVDEMRAFDRVITDHVSGAEQLVDCLADSGSRKILRLWTQSSSTPWIAAHNTGYTRAVVRRGLEELPSLHVEDLPDRGHDERSFRARVRHVAGYLAESFGTQLPIDAIMVGTDCEALVALAACRLFGRTDIRVTGYDNYWQSIHERQWEPAVPFATVEKDNHRLGTEMVDLLLKRIEGALSAEPCARLVEQKLVVTS